jgi:predicted ATPase
MKVSRIEIKDFQQFKDFELDLTYPEGHKKTGQPLDKVCFIGQSGTGKTTILSLISDLVENATTKSSWGDFKSHNFIYRMDYSILENKNLGFALKFRTNENRELYYQKNNFNWEEGDKLNTFFTEFGRLKNSVIFLETGLENHTHLITGLNPYSLPIVHTQGDINEIKQQQEEIIRRINQIACINSNSYFSEDTTQFYIFQKLYAHNELVKGVSNKLYNNALNGDIEKILLELKEWKEQNPNPRVELSKKMGNILAKFNIKIDTESTQDYIKLKTLQDTEISIQAASTGTKQILLSAIPLALIETQHKIILFDEPERSLFPDVQRTLIKYYTDLAPEAQFFFATHSPIIASQFEPWEIVELKFDESGNVYREKFYEGENKVENYTIFPQYLRWDSILTKVFDMEYNSNEARNGKLNELTALEVKLRKLKTQEGASKEEILALWAEYEKLANLLDWQIK